MNQYSFLKTIAKGIKYGVIYLLSFIVMGLLANTAVADLTIIDFLAKTTLGNLTIGSLAVMLLNWLKVKVGVKLP